MKCKKIGLLLSISTLLNVNLAYATNIETIDTNANIYNNRLSTVYVDTIDYINKIQYAKESENLNLKINTDNNATVNEELNKISNDIKRLLVANNITIEVVDGLIYDFEEGVETYGVYYWEENRIELDSNDYSIKYSCLHEIGHALDDILDYQIREDEVFINSWMSDEIYFKNDHFSIYDAEYLAQCVYLYFNGDLAHGTEIYKVINKYLSCL